MPDTDYRVDCLPCVRMVHVGEQAATEGRRQLARVFRLLFTAIHDPKSVVWMPAHTTEEDVAVKRIGNGRKLTAIDRDSNGLADQLAKFAVEEHRVPEQVRKAVKRHFELQEDLIRWIGKVGVMANHSTTPPARDTDASRKAGLQAAAARRALRANCGRSSRTKSITARPAALGGHRLVMANSGRWNCMVCKRSAAKSASLAPGQCNGSVAKRLAARTKAIVDSGGSLGSHHKFMMSGDVLWCSICGAFAEGCGTMALARPCQGKRIRGPRQSYGQGGRNGLAQQLRNLQKGLHPRLAPCSRLPSLSMLRLTCLLS